MVAIMQNTKSIEEKTKEKLAKAEETKLKFVTIGMDEFSAEFQAEVATLNNESDDDDDEDVSSSQHVAAVKEHQDEISGSSGPVKFKVVQWNQKWLRPGDDDGSNDKRCQFISATIQKIDPGVVMMEEVMQKKGDLPGNHGALDLICEKLNSSKKYVGHPWRYKLSGVVDADRRGENFACIYRRDIVGEPEVQVLFTGGFKLSFDVWNDQRHTNEMRLEEFNQHCVDNIFNIRVNERVSVNMEEPIRLYEEFQQSSPNRFWFSSTIGDRTSYHQGRDPGFDYKPCRFYFNRPEMGVSPFHIVVVHGSTGQKKVDKSKQKIPEQNMLEMLYVQHFCSQLVEQNEFVILLGDFNTQEVANGLMGIWDKDLNIPITSSKYDPDWHLFAPKLIREITNPFLAVFDRVISSAIPTNVFPFLPGLVQSPKHNDDIWVPSKKGIPWSWSKGRCLPIPDFVLREWDNATQRIYEGSNILSHGQVSNDDGSSSDDDNTIGIGSQTAKRTDIKATNKHLRKASTINSVLASMWSDHRPVVVTLTHYL